MIEIWKVINWSWTDGSIFNYTSWCGNEPVDSVGWDCGSYLGAAGNGPCWTSGGCITTKYFACQINIYSTHIPSNNPTNIPTNNPTYNPTILPTILPTYVPSIFPSLLPSLYPTNIPTIAPTLIPTNLPSLKPTLIPTLRMFYATFNAYLCVYCDRLIKQLKLNF